MAISTFEYRKQQDYMLQKMIAERTSDPAVARTLQQQLEYELKKRALSLEDWQDGYAPQKLYAKLAEMEAKIKAEEAQAKLKAVQAHLAAPHMQCTLSTAVNLWIVKFGDGWVTRQDVANAVQPGEMHWFELGSRLVRTGKMEVHEDFWRIIT